MIRVKKQKIVVTGSAGFIGSHLVDYLSSKGYKVWGIDDLSGGFMRNVSREARKTFFKLDLKNRSLTSKVLSKIKPDVVYHLAAWAHEGLSQFSPVLITENNYNSYLNVLVSAIMNDVKRIVCCSSMSVYGDQEAPFSEKMARKPVDIYAVAKTAMEEATEILAKVYGYEYVIVRPHNVYGPNQNMADPYRNVVAIFINRMLMNKPFYIYGDGEQKRAFTYIDDIIPQLANAGFSDKVNGEIINLGVRTEHTINQLANRVLECFDRTSIKKYGPIYLKNRPLEVKEAFCTSDKAQKLLGIYPETSLREGISKMVDWAKGLGPQVPVYLPTLELSGENTPKTWKHKLI